MISSKSLHLPINSTSLWGVYSPPAEYCMISVGQSLYAWQKDTINPTTQKPVGQIVPGWQQMCVDVLYVQYQAHNPFGL